MRPIFITGIGTGIGKTVVAAIVARAIKADYWKPVQAGIETGTDSEWIQDVLKDTGTKIHPETYKLRLAASPHIAAREEGIRVDLDVIMSQFVKLSALDAPLVIEGAGGLMVPLNEDAFVIDLIEKLNPKVILVSRNYLGSINHSLLTAQMCESRKLDVAGWIFNDQYLSYEEEIARWSDIPKIASIPFATNPDSQFIAEQSLLLNERMQQLV